MGQKTNPKAFRLGTTQKHLSEWFHSKSCYAKLAFEDFTIRQKIEKRFEDLLEVASVHIERGIFNIKKENDKILITLKALHPRKKDVLKKMTSNFLKEDKNISLGLFFRGQKNKLKKYFQNFLKQKIREITRNFNIIFKKKIYFKLSFIQHIFEDAHLIAKYIGKQIRLRVPFRRVMKYTLKKMEFTPLEGLKIEISGRLNGVEIARSEWKRVGKIPLHTLKANIQYSCYKVFTVYGIIGIKIWTYNT